MWTQRLKRAIKDSEFKTGLTPSAILVRPEVYSELCFEEYGSFTLELTEFDGALLSANDSLERDYLILVDVFNVDAVE